MREVEDYPPPPITDAKSGEKEKAERPRRKRGKEKTSVADSVSIDKFGVADSGIGTTDPGHFLPRERFSYWCFDLLFLVCSETSKGEHT